MKIFVIRGEWRIECEDVKEALNILADIEEAAAKRNCELDDSGVEEEE